MIGTCLVKAFSENRTLDYCLLFNLCLRSEVYSNLLREPHRKFTKVNTNEFLSFFRLSYVLPIGNFSLMEQALRSSSEILEVLIALVMLIVCEIKCFIIWFLIGTLLGARRLLSPEKYLGVIKKPMILLSSFQWSLLLFLKR